MDVDKLIQYGLPTVLLGWLCYALWHAVSWTGTNVVVPMRDRISRHFDGLDLLFKSIESNGERQTELLERIDERLGKNGICRAPYMSTTHKPT